MRRVPQHRLVLSLVVGSVGVLILGSLLSFAAPPGQPRTIGWAEARANTGVAIDLHDYYGLTLRFVSARTGAACSGAGAAASSGGVRRWWQFRCTTRLHGDEGPEFPGVVAVAFTLRVPATNGARPTVSAVHVTSCAGKACPIH